ncbi:MetQ/NlpA family ABC transporter substrate-binding protein, partial [Enterobacter hormaechei]|uniref:MetQ/NlpA family ABC transporter substrate-binding protein n=1 Tax=Enterobacter hormaechei TaxID=158836 RepID=UPI001F0A284E
PIRPTKWRLAPPNYSSQIGLSPAKDGLFVEDKNSPYVNIFASRIDNKDSEKVKDLVKAYQTDEVAASAAELLQPDWPVAGQGRAVCRRQ